MECFKKGAKLEDRLQEIERAVGSLKTMLAQALELREKQRVVDDAALQDIVTTQRDNEAMLNPNREACQLKHVEKSINVFWDSFKRL